MMSIHAYTSSDVSEEIKTGIVMRFGNHMSPDTDWDTKQGGGIRYHEQGRALELLTGSGRYKRAGRLSRRSNGSCQVMRRARVVEAAQPQGERHTGTRQYECSESG
jgi:hypothetical protein